MFFVKNLFSQVVILFFVFFLTSCNSAEQQSQMDTKNSTQINTKMNSAESTFVTTEKNKTYELSEFTLAEPEHIKLRAEKDFATFNFDDNELIELFDEAWYIKTYYFECLWGKHFFSNYGETTNENEETYTHSGVSYDSFVSFLNNYFTEEYTDKLLNTGVTEYGDGNIIIPYKNINGELCYSGGFERGTSPALDSITINIIEQKDDEITITVTARYCHPDNPDKEQFNDFDCVVKMTENGWRVDYLKLWYWG